MLPYILVDSGINKDTRTSCNNFI